MRISFFLFLAVITFSSYGQNFLITNKMDTLYGDISFDHSSNDLSLKNEIDKYTLKPYQINSIYYKNDIYKPIVYNKTRVFAKEVIKGNLNLYLIRPEDGYEFSTEILLKTNGDIIEIPRIGFKKYVSDFLVECTDLASKIKDGTYKFGNLNTIIEEYNTNCSTINVEPGVIAELKDLNQLLSDIYSKLDQNEPIPPYLKKALKEYENQDLKRMIEELLEKMEE